MSRGSLTARVLQHMEDHDRPEGFTAGELSEATGMSTGQMSSLWKIYGDGASRNMVRWKNGEEPPHHVPAAAKKRRQKEREEDPHAGIFYYRLTSAPAPKAGAPKAAAPKAAAADAEPPKKRHKKISIQAAIQSIACTACRRRDDEGSLVLCDGCDDAWHTFCMSPKRTEVPSGDWFCQHCLQAAQLRREGRTGGRRAKVPAPWNSAIVGHTVYLCTEAEGWRCGQVTACFCDAPAADEASAGRTAATPTTPTAGVEYEVHFAGHPSSPRPKSATPVTERVSWLWLRQGRRALIADEAERLIGRPVRKRFAGHGIFAGKVAGVKLHPQDGLEDVWFQIQCAPSASPMFATCTRSFAQNWSSSETWFRS